MSVMCALGRKRTFGLDVRDVWKRHRGLGASRGHSWPLLLAPLSIDRQRCDGAESAGAIETRSLDN